MKALQLVGVLVLLSISPAIILSQEHSDSTATKVTNTATHANTTEGLKQLLLEMRAAAQDGNESKLSAFVKQTEIPNCDAWLHEMYDSDKADSWMELCDPKALGTKEESMRDLFKRLANEDGRILTRKVNDNPQPGKGLEWGWLQAIKEPLDIYWASWLPASQSNESEADPIGYFMFIEGTFRWESNFEFTKVSLTKGPTPPVNATIPAQDKAASDRLIVARGQYYTPTASGLKSFRCEATIDWKALLTRFGGTEIPDDNPVLKYLQTVHLSVTDQLKGQASMEWSDTGVPPRGKGRGYEADP
jgi:hypothetical protein